MDRASSSADHGLPRQLNLRDLIISQVLCVVGSAWVGVAAGLGKAETLMWVGAMVLFYVPMAASVIGLNRAMPLEGGTYQWVKAGISPFAGYLAAWNASFYTITVFGTFGPRLVNSRGRNC